MVTKRRLANLLLVWVAFLSVSQCASSSRFSIFSNCHYPHSPCRRKYGLSQQPSARLAFVLCQERKTNYPSFCRRAGITSVPINPGYSWSLQRSSVSLGAGRERRISSSANDPKNQQQRQRNRTQQNYSQEQRKLVEKEESARRKRLQQMEQRFQKAVRREDRILFLEAKLARERERAAPTTRTSLQGSLNASAATESEDNQSDKDASCITDAEKAELEGLLRVRDNYEEHYNPQEFSEEHLAFKTLHNDVFARLVRWCEKDRTRQAPTLPGENLSSTKVFFLDGPDGGTASSLVHKGNFAPTQCFVANRHESTCVALRNSGGGLLPDENVVHATSSEALTKGAAPGATEGALAHLDFTGYYFDGCAGYAPHIVNMMSAALLVLEEDSGILVSNSSSNSNGIQSRHPPIVVGYSLLGGTKYVVEKELEISRALTVIARSRGMRVVHALDDPSRFGLPPEVPKLGGNGGNTFTTWLILQPE